MKTPLSILKKYWGYDAFRPLQEEIIRHILQKKDTLALLPTGGGKSICYQVPALLMEGTCLVVSPLIALMKDQAENLERRGIKTLVLHASMQRREMEKALQKAIHGHFNFLFVSPERLDSNLFKEYLPALDISLLAVDEAHCIAQWGYDFRPSYLKISELRAGLNEVPVLALTASATPEVEEDICTRLAFSERTVFRQSYQRPNLSYSVFAVPSTKAKLTQIVDKVKGSALVYCRSRKRTVEIAQLLQMQGINAQYYHAGLDAEERNRRQQLWIENKIVVMVCTNAFGMGIDKADVRLVVHADLPDCLESYYQEAGRAGRDGNKSYAVLLHQEKDISELESLHVTRFPPVEKIKTIYEALVNFLQIAAGTGEGQTFNFHFDSFVRNFSLESTETLYTLKTLETDGWIYFNERSFTPSTVCFTTDKNGLYAFQQAHPEYEEVLTILLRTYEGIFDYPAAVSEKGLARLLRREEAFIKKSLVEIDAFRIISYRPQNEAPQIIFRKNRVPVTDFRINAEAYERRREAFIRRAQKMIAYTKSEGCRSRFINEYFGDLTPPCGICDACLNKAAGELTPEVFRRIHEQVLHLLRIRSQSAGDLLAGLRGVHKEKIWKVLQFLQAEGIIAADSEGRLQLKQPVPSSAGGANTKHTQ